MSTDIAQRQMELFAPIEQAAHLPAGSLSIVGLELTDPDMTLADWQELGRKLGHVHRWTSWALGDWINFGEAIFGEDAAQGAEGTTADRYDVAGRVTGLAPQTLLNYAHVCRSIPRRLRRVELPFSVHEPVAKLAPEDQEAWLQKAVDGSWTREELRTAIREDATGLEPAADPEPEPQEPAGGLSRAERLEVLAQFVYQHGQPTGNGTHVVELPDETWAQLANALGYE